MLHMYRSHPRFTLLLSLLVMTLGLSGCRSTTTQTAAQTTTERPIHVVASVDFYGEVAQAVLGQHGTVTSLIKSASIDPHDFEPTPKDATQVSRATVVLGNGLGYDGWLDKLVKSTHQSPRLIHVGEDVMHLKTGVNEHIWYNPQTMPQLASYLATQFGKQAPRYRQAYRQNAQAYIRQLKPLQAQITRLKANSRHQAVAASEPVFDYALSALGYRRISQRFEHAVENGTDPAPKDVHRLQTAIRHRKIAFFVNNQQASNKTVAGMVQLAKQSGVPVLNVTETRPHGLTYKQWMQRQYTVLDRIQKQSPRN